MDLFGGSQSVDSADSEKSSCLSSRSVFPTDQTTDLLWNKVSLEPPAVSFSGESRYLTPLWVSRNDDPKDELYKAENMFWRIRAVLKLLAMREQYVLVQFWLARVVGKHQLLTTLDQPFGLGVVNEDLCFYRRDSERITFFVDKDHAEEDVSPPARVFRQGLPEWASDLSNYLPKDFQQQDIAIRCNLHGYLSLPVFDSTTSLCIGVIELLMSSMITDYAFEVQQVHKALKTQSLTSPQVSDFTTNAPNEQRLIELDILHGITDVGAGSHCFNRGRKRKTCSGSIQRAKVEATLDRSFIKLRSLTPFKFLVLNKEVVRRFNLEGKRLRIKYKDEDNDWILITCDADLALAFKTSDRKSISIRCEAD